MTKIWYLLLFFGEPPQDEITVDLRWQLEISKFPTEAHCLALRDQWRANGFNAECKVATIDERKP